MTRRTDWAEYAEDGAWSADAHHGHAAETHRDMWEAAETEQTGEIGETGLGWDTVDLPGLTGTVGLAGAGGAAGSTAATGSPDRPGSRRSGTVAGRRGSRRGRGARSSADRRDGGEERESGAPQDPAERARQICLRLLTGTPRTRKQLADALSKRQIPDDTVDEVLSRFEEVGLIDDGAFADAWVESRHHGRGLARRALARELRTRGVDSELIDEAVAKVDSDQEEATARELVARKLRATRGLDRDKRVRRLAGMLARKGYSQGLALRVVRQALEEEGEDTEFFADQDF